MPATHWLRVEVTKVGNRRYEWRLLDLKRRAATDSTEHYDADYDAEEYTADCLGRGGTYYRQRVAEAHAQDVRVEYEYALGELLEAALDAFGHSPKDLERARELLKAYAEDAEDRRTARRAGRGRLTHPQRVRARTRPGMLRRLWPISHAGVRGDAGPMRRIDAPSSFAQRPAGSKRAYTHQRPIAS